jgi:phytoene dehydrogenase-like protein
MLERSVAETGEQVGMDAKAYKRLMSPLVHDKKEVLQTFLGPLGLPRHPIATVRFGLPALLPAVTLVQALFRGVRARALFAGLSAHSILPLEMPTTSSFGLMLGMLAHAVGWPIIRGGTGQLARVLVDYLSSLRGEVVTDSQVRSVKDIPSARAVLFDVTPRQLVHIAGDRLPVRYRRQLQAYHYGPGVYKVDYALSAPIPWRASECARSATVHLGGSWIEIALSERLAWSGKSNPRPFVIVVQPTLFDPSRAPEGKHIAWAYCHVPNGSNDDMSDIIDEQIERFAPGFKDVVLARSRYSPSMLETYNSNYVGGDINGGAQDPRQLFTRPVPSLHPYSIPVKGWYLCSSSTPPGGGVHGMCGYHAARAALKYLRIA